MGLATIVSAVAPHVLICYVKPHQIDSMVDGSPDPILSPLKFKYLNFPSLFGAVMKNIYI